MCVACGNWIGKEKLQESPFESEAQTTEAAMILTDHLINFVMVRDWLSDEYVFSSEDVYKFLTSLCLYKDQLSHPYSNKISLSEDCMNYIVSSQNVEQIASELFGIEDLHLESYDGYEEDEKQFTIPVGIGLRNTGYSYNYVSHYTENNNLCICIQLIKKDSYGDSEIVDYGNYVLRFQYVDTNTNKYLRVVTISNLDEVHINENLKNALDNNSLLYDTDANEKIYISDYFDNRGLAMSKYSIVDLNGDSSPEIVGWLSRGTNDYWGFLVLHYEDDMVYAYELAYRTFNELKKDGTFMYSSSVSDYGIGRIDFMSDTYKINKIAYSEAEYGTQKVSYYIDNIKVSKNDFMAYKAKQSEKQNVDWNPVTTNSASS